MENYQRIPNTWLGFMVLNHTQQGGGSPVLQSLSTILVQAEHSIPDSKQKHDSSQLMLKRFVAMSEGLIEPRTWPEGSSHQPGFEAKEHESSLGWKTTRLDSTSQFFSPVLLVVYNIISQFFSFINIQKWMSKSCSTFWIPKSMGISGSILWSYVNAPYFWQYESCGSSDLPLKLRPKK